jgi:ABC-2 type transport system ATP-binding protein
LRNNAEHCISVKNLSFKYKSRQVLENISIDLEYGKVLGFLGPNGAGKTTTVKILSTLLKPFAGSVKIFGLDTTKFSSNIKERIGVVFQHPSFEESLTVERALDIYGLLWNLEKDQRKAKIKEILDEFHLRQIKDTSIAELSIGQKRRVQVAREFMHNMDLLFLDEPTVGLDPYARRLLLDYIKRKVNSGLTVLFTTHIMEEAEYLCDQIAIINKGKIVTIDTPIGIKEKYGNTKIIEIRINRIIDEFVRKTIRSIIFNTSDVTFPKNNIIRINSIGAQEVMSRLISAFSKDGVLIENISINNPSLEDVFLTIIKEN